MCTNEVDAPAVDVAGLLAAPAGSAVLAVLERLDPMSLSEPDRLILLEVHVKQQAWLAALEVPAMIAVAGVEPVDDDDFVREDVRAALRLSRQGAHERIETARLLNSTLIASRDALAQGELSTGQVRRLYEELRALPADVAVAAQTLVLPKAHLQTVAEFGRSLKRAILKADPKTAEEQHALAVQTRSVVMYPEPDAMATIITTQPAHQAQTNMAALTAIATAAKQADPDPRRCTMDQRRADALYTLCAAALADPTLPKRHGKPATIGVVVDLPTLLGLAEHPAQLAGYGPIPASIARKLASDGTWQRMVLEPVTGHLLDLGSTKYRPNQELTDYILARNPECTFPACHTPSVACDIDHTQPFNHRPEPSSHADGGTTSSHNRRPRCKRHHQL